MVAMCYKQITATNFALEKGHPDLWTQASTDENLIQFLLLILPSAFQMIYFALLAPHRAITNLGGMGG